MVALWLFDGKTQFALCYRTYMYVFQIIYVKGFRYIFLDGRWSVNDLLIHTYVYIHHCMLACWHVYSVSFQSLFEEMCGISFYNPRVWVWVEAGQLMRVVFIRRSHLEFLSPWQNVDNFTKHSVWVGYGITQQTWKWKM